MLCYDCLYYKECDEDLCQGECEHYHVNILSALKSIEKKYDVTILYAVENGSRCWGFDNEYSDYDIRFVYKYNDLKNYVSLSSKQDVIKCDDDIFDIMGWDISKALKLHYKNNPGLREMILTDYVYIDDELGVFEGLPDFEKSVLLNHYFSMCRNNWNDYCEGKKYWLGCDEELFLIKKYLYVIRGILTWHILYETDVVPCIRFDDLLQQCENSVITMEFSVDIKSLMDYYKDNGSLNNSIIERISEWIISNLKIMKVNTPKVSKSKNDWEVYDDKFYSIVMRE